MKLSHLLILLLGLNLSSCAKLLQRAPASEPNRAIILFTKDGPLENYAQLLRSIAPGSTLTFPDGKSFKIIGGMKHGSSNAVFPAREIINDETSLYKVALKLPLPEEKAELYGPEKAIKHAASVNEYTLLRSKGVPLPKLYSAIPGEYVAMEYIDSLFSADHFFEEFATYDEATRGEVINALKLFAWQTSGFAEIGDFGAFQIVYSQVGQWILIDWDSGSRLVTKGESLTLFSKDQLFAQYLLEDLELSSKSLAKKVKLILKELDQEVVLDRQNPCDHLLTKILFSNIHPLAKSGGRAGQLVYHQ